MFSLENEHTWYLGATEDGLSEPTLAVETLNLIAYFEYQTPGANGSGDNKKAPASDVTPGVGAGKQAGQGVQVCPLQKKTGIHTRARLETLHGSGFRIPIDGVRCGIFRCREGRERLATNSELSPQASTSTAL